ncbi:MAG: DNA polymerase IV [Planctomycetaceae bacterium]|nr:DNA polymerase IV [Planctomycetaceae bacterium]
MILHVDMDAFYASVEEREQPSLKGRPLIVGGTPEGRGVVCAANYAARQFGIHSAMATATALRKCPGITVLRPRMELYAAVSRQIREIFERYTPVIEPLSLDEAFLDATGSVQLFGSVEQIGRRIKQDIRDELQLVASVGVAPNKYLAKLASDMDKPDGFTVIAADRIQAVLDPLPISRIWGVGRVTEQRMQQYRIHTIGDLRALDKAHLRQLFGSSGDHFWQLARGIDDRAVVPDREAKSISHENTFAQDITDLDVLRAWLLELTELVARRLRRNQLQGRTVHLKVKYSNFDSITRSASLPAATSTTARLWDAVSELLTSRLPDRPLVVRLLGMGVSQFETESTTQLSLFDEPPVEEGRDNRLDQVADQIRDRFGSKSLRRASTVEHQTEHRPQPRPE